MLFNLFGKKENPLGIEQYEFERTIDGKTYDIAVDLSHEQFFLEKKTHDDVVVVAFMLLRIVGEHERLTSALLGLTKGLCSITKAVFVGTIRDSAVLIGYIATTNPVEEASIRELLGTHKQVYTVTPANDPGWVFLTQTLYPTAVERQHKNNLGLIALVKTEQGKDAVAPSGVEHSLVFKNIESGKGFLKETEPLGYFQIGMQSVQDRTYPLLFVLRKPCTITLKDIDTQTDFLITLADKHQGRYEGWQATATQ